MKLKIRLSLIFGMVVLAIVLVTGTVAYNKSVDMGTKDAKNTMQISADLASKEIEGKLDTRYIYEGAVVPLQDNEGHRFSGLIALIQDNTVTVDLNHPLAGKTLRFVGTVVTARPATDDEVSNTLKALSGEGGCGGCGGEGGCGGCSGGCGDGECGSCCGDCQ